MQRAQKQKESEEMQKVQEEQIRKQWVFVFYIFLYWANNLISSFYF